MKKILIILIFSISFLACKSQGILKGTDLQLSRKIVYKNKIWLNDSLDMNSKQITNLPKPTTDKHAVNKKYADSLASKTNEIRTDTVIVKLVKSDTIRINNTIIYKNAKFLEDSLNMRGYGIYNLRSPKLLSHAVNKRYADSVVKIIEEISFEFRDITPGTAQTYVLDLKAFYGYTIESAVLETDNGTLTGVAVKIGSTAVTSLSSLTVDTSADETASTGAKTVVTGDKVIIETSTGYTGTPTLLRGKIKIKRT